MKIFIPVFNDYEDIELITTLDILKRAQIPFEIYSFTDDNKIFGDVSFVNAITRIPNDLSEYNAVFLHGGQAVKKWMRGNDELIEIIKKFKSQKKWIFAICDAPNFLYENQIITDSENYTSYPIPHIKKGTNHDKYEKVIVTEKLITARGPACAIEFAFAIVQTLKGVAETDALKFSMQNA